MSFSLEYSVFLFVLVAVTVVNGCRLDPNLLVENYESHLENASLELNVPEFYQQLTSASVEFNTSTDPTELGEVMFNNWYTFEKVYRSALDKGGLPSNLIDFAVTEARLYCLVRSAQAQDKIDAKHKDLSINYKILSEGEKAIVERALPNAAEMVTSPENWRK
ncbi:unnamed protein product [Bursaphelenchus xylophilus]|uniref:(pine wood nematode) hypothetical protein n=1 Tax=Bursaphelenchus xylophilus TaxID=6326 RepID=A0A1I7SL14_BURXY|nr:unnamed protein product [Bursaphelenchus xylophilus]CAG9129333.1 unnamed protein product [Bursaphelenchus xylophilus]